ncbi:hypothetical protein K443DRAFT_160985 [Laccaria amethystina LaAM-08-1]|uniref:Uncharacterized protein n=1 Tax=Laccaria amethystina LaAM-08-1 TaxID=1095629 RepID=A0A0C9X3W8_9AGAR|nr:hypothetical protein K443DRAFT_160985 [Laccaria amethystina LaAM-08-1]
MDIKVQTTCRGGSPAHPIALKNLIPVKFTSSFSDGTSQSTESALAGNNTASASSSSSSKVKKDEPEPMCLSCKKHCQTARSCSVRFSPSFSLLRSFLFVLSADTLYSMKPCALTCKTCTESLVRPVKPCIGCDTQLKEKDIIELKREGTGFARGGMAETSRAGIAFQGLSTIETKLISHQPSHWQVAHSTHSPRTPRPQRHLRHSATFKFWLTAPRLVH